MLIESLCCLPGLSSENVVQIGLMSKLKGSYINNCFVKIIVTSLRHIARIPLAIFQSYFIAFHLQVKKNVIRTFADAMLDILSEHIPLQRFRNIFLTNCGYVTKTFAEMFFEKQYPHNIFIALQENVMEINFFYKITYHRGK